MGAMQRMFEDLLAGVGAVDHKTLPFPRLHDIAQAGFEATVNAAYKSPPPNHGSPVRRGTGRARPVPHLRCDVGYHTDARGAGWIFDRHRHRAGDPAAKPGAAGHMGAGKEDAPHFKTKDQAQRISDLILRHFNGIVWRLENDPDVFEPIFDAMTCPDDRRAYIDGESWAHGFMQGIALRQQDWQQLFDDARGQEWLRPLYLLGADEVTPEEEALTRWPDRTFMNGSSRPRFNARRRRSVATTRAPAAAA